MGKRDRLEKFKNGNMTESESDKFIKELIHDNMYTQKKEEYAKELSRDYGVKKENKTTKPNIFKWASAFFLLLVAIVMFLKFTGDKEKSLPTIQMAQAYLESNSLEYGDQFRGEETINALRKQAYDQYVLSEHRQAVETWGMVGLDKLVAKDKLYYGISLLNTKQNEKAFEILGQSMISIRDGEDWYTETEFYYVLSCIAIGKPDLANKIISSWQPNSWSNKEFQKINTKSVKG